VSQKPEVPIPYVDDDSGRRYYHDEVTGETTWEHPEGEDMEWKEFYSEDHGRPYFHNLKTDETSWDRPAELGWRRVEHEIEL